jgi:hypothetical protein
MQVRDAVEADAEGLSRLADAPTDVMRGVVHDRTVRVLESPAAETRGESGSGADSEDDASGSDLVGFVSFDARSETVYVTQLAGESADACSRLLQEPRRFADCEDMAVEFVVEDTHDAARRAAREEGFEAVGPGPRFEGEETTRFRLDPS